MNIIKLYNELNISNNEATAILNAELRRRGCRSVALARLGDIIRFQGAIAAFPPEELKAFAQYLQDQRDRYVEQLIAMTPSDGR